MNAMYVKYCDMLVKMKLATDTRLTVGCGDCMDNYVDVGGFCVANLSQQNYLCNVENCEYCVQNNYCGKCADGYHTQIYTGGMCFKDYSPFPNCQLSIIWAPICLMCNEGYVNKNGECLKFNPDVTC